MNRKSAFQSGNSGLHLPLHDGGGSRAYSSERPLRLWSVSMLPFTSLKKVPASLPRSERYPHVWHTAGTQDMPAE